MTRRWIPGLLACLLSTVAVGQQAAESPEPDNPFAKLNWIEGPTEVTVAGQATLQVPEGYVYLDPGETSKFQELLQNPTDGSESLIGPDDLHWFGLFEFDDIGFVKDDEEIDAAELLASVRSGTEASNALRRERGWPELHVVGWKFEPRYDTTTNRLEWAILGESQGETTVNFNTRLLGRKGVTSAILVAGEEELDAATADFKQILTGFSYLPGQGYADVQEGDKIAEYGLAALIAGGGAAVAAKSGLLKGLWKFILGAGVLAMAGLGKLFGRKKADA
jgi:uncharacterized membrane-anchored protein